MESATSSYGLIERIKRGDREAFTPLFEQIRPRLAVLAHYRLGAELRQFIEIEDILQETLLRGYREFDSFTYQGPGSFLRWLSRIAEHVIVDTARHRYRAKRHAELVPFKSSSNPAGPDPAHSQTPSRVLRARESVRELVETLDALPEHYRRAILLSRVEGLSTEEIGRELGKTREAAALILHRALKRFRELHDQGATR